MKWLKTLMGRASPSAPGSSLSIAGPLGLAAGKTLMLDNALKFILEGKTGVAIPASQGIWSSGVIDLGQSNWLSRYYLDDDATWVQVHTTGDQAGQVESVILFNYLACVTIGSESEVRRLAGSASPIGMPSYQHNGLEFQREWGTEVGQTELVRFHERVTSPNESYGVAHHAMLYSRETGLAGRREFLLFSVEEDEAGSVSLSTALGVSLYTTDLMIL